MKFWQKEELTIHEACSYFHIGEKKFREIINANPNANFICCSECGRHMMIRRIQLKAFLDQKNYI